MNTTKPIGSIFGEDTKKSGDKLVAVLLLASMFLFQGLPPVRADVQIVSNEERRTVQTIQKLVKRNKWPKIDRLTRKISNPILKNIILWQKLTTRNSGASFDQIAAFIDNHRDWPKVRLLHKRAEEAMTPQIADEIVLDWFKGRRPLSADGGIHLGRALLAQNHKSEAVRILRDTWVNGNFGVKQERYFYKRYRRYLTREDHIKRLDRLLWLGRYYPIRRMYRRVNKDYRALAEARITLRRFRGGVDRAISRVPDKLQGHPGLLYERLRWRRRKGRDISAREILEKLPDDLIRPDLWWREKVVLSRRALQDGHFSEAYRLAKNHHLKNGSGFIEGEWLAGWIALRFLNDTKVAYGHFTELFRKAKYPISLSRGAYWAGRAAEKQNDKKHARFWYSTAALYPITYYGQLAAATLKKKAIEIPPNPHVTAEKKLAFNSHAMVKVVKVMADAGLQDLMRSFIRKLNTMAETPGWRSEVAGLARAGGRPDLAIRTAKIAYRQGANLIEDGFPLLPTKTASDLELSLIHAVIRQESAFNKKAISHAGARGLMQLMPYTAKRVAKRKSLPYVRRNLTEDTDYNLSLGTAYLGELVKEFNGSYILALSAYNAGPARAKRWLKKYGDPRDLSVDAIDWVELIPFSETRNYVQRVMENLHVYRHRLSSIQLAFNPEGDLRR